MTTKLKGTEMLDEVQWFLDADVHPRLILQTLGRTAASIDSAARLYGYHDVGRIFRNVMNEDRQARRNAG